MKTGLHGNFSSPVSATDLVKSSQETWQVL